ncbi:MAG TPA: metallophosphoesterase, partial [Kofleriaceae bacterium]|nr:metallophosphoesterase [Kofleriaceae bacterium]
DFIQEMVERVNAINGDAIVITGDLVDGQVDDLRDAAAPLAELRARHGVYFVTGNHEYYSGVDPWLAHIETLGIRALRNEHVRIDDDGVGFDLAGIDDHGAHRYRGHGADLAKAVAGRNPARELVLLAHQPRQVKMAVQHGVGLQLSGHTHGGQIWPWHYVAAAQQGGLLAGLSRHGDTQLYVSRGTGYWGPPVRVLATAEITRVVLRAGRRAG